MHELIHFQTLLLRLVNHYLGASSVLEVSIRKILIFWRSIVAIMSYRSQIMAMYHLRDVIYRSHFHNMALVIDISYKTEALALPLVR